MTVIGIDPGFSGALAAYNCGDGTIVSIIDMPLREPITLGGAKQRQIDPAPIIDFISHHKPALIVLERVHAMPDQGVSSTFRFGEGYGLIQGIVAALHIRLILSPPAVWKMAMSVSANKSSSLEAVRTQFPASTYFARKKDDGRAEALLLAMFGARSLNLSSRGNGGDKIHDIL